MGEDKKAKEEQTISMTEMAEMMQTIKSILAEIKPQLTTLTTK